MLFLFLFTGKEKGVSEFIRPRLPFPEGDLRAPEAVRIDGTVNGNCTCEKELIIGKNGHVKGNISAQHVIISGRVEGDIAAQGKLELLSTGKLVGNISARSLGIVPTFTLASVSEALLLFLPNMIFPPFTLTDSTVLSNYSAEQQYLSLNTSSDGNVVATGVQRLFLRLQCHNLLFLLCHLPAHILLAAELIPRKKALFAGRFIIWKSSWIEKRAKVW